MLSAVLITLAAPIGMAASFIAQATGGGSSYDFSGIATLLAQVGLSAVFLWQWQSERKERAAAQDHLRDFMEKFAPTLSDAIGVLKDVKTGLVKTVERVQIVPDRSDYDMVLRRLELLASEMNDMTQRITKDKKQ